MNFPTKPIKDLQTLKSYESTLLSLMQLHRSIKEIMSSLLVKLDLLNEWALLYYEGDFEAVLETFKDRSNANLVEKEYELALAGNAKMLQFLGKNYAKQSDQLDLQALIQDQVVVIDDYTEEGEKECN